MNNEKLIMNNDWNPNKIWDKDANHKAFQLIKNDSRFQKHKLFVEALYEEYCPDEKFEIKLIHDWDAMIWQMYLTIFLSKKGFKLEKPKESEPDIKIYNIENPIWVECISVNKGNTFNAPNDIPNGRIWGEPNEKEICLRLANGIRDKHEQYLKRIQKKVIQQYNPYIIALSTATLQNSMTELDATYLRRILFGIGKERIFLQTNENGEYNDYLDVEYEQRLEIKDYNNNPHDTYFFGSESYKGISGILLTTADPIYFHDFNSSRIFFYHNPYAINKLPLDYFQFGRVGYIRDNCLEEIDYEQ